VWQNYFDLMGQFEDSSESTAGEIPVALTLDNRRRGIRDVWTWKEALCNKANVLFRVGKLRLDHAQFTLSWRHRDFHIPGALYDRHEHGIANRQKPSSRCASIPAWPLLTPGLAAGY
jgi:hypothetical protein